MYNLGPASISSMALSVVLRELSRATAQQLQTQACCLQILATVFNSLMPQFPHLKVRGGSHSLPHGGAGETRLTQQAFNPSPTALPLFLTQGSHAYPSLT